MLVGIDAGLAVARVSHGAVRVPLRVQDGRVVRPLELEVLVLVVEADPVALRCLVCNVMQKFV